MVRPNYQQRVENVRYYARCENHCGNTIRNKKHPNTAFYWKEMGLCMYCFLQTNRGQEYSMVNGKVVSKRSKLV